MTAEEKVKARLIKGIGRELSKGWLWAGTEFFNLVREWVTPQTSVLLRFRAGCGWVAVSVETEFEYGIPDREEKFTGEDSVAKAVIWAAERVIEADKIVSERVAPYRKGFQDYERALRGIL